MAAPEEPEEGDLQRRAGAGYPGRQVVVRESEDACGQMQQRQGHYGGEHSEQQVRVQALAGIVPTYWYQEATPGLLAGMAGAAEAPVAGKAR